MCRATVQQESPLSFDESTGFTAPSAFGTYRVLHQIGSGVLGPVFRTYDPQHDRLIAVKAFRLDIIPERAAQLAESLRRLAGSGLTHPSIVAPVEAGLEGSTAFLAMEYVAAETLDVALRHLAPMPLERALPLLRQAADAIGTAWARGVGHGALHPRDMFVAADSNEIRVTGFGVVPALEALGIKAPVRRPYSAPERANGDAWDERADVFSLGSIAHELLTRRRPAGAGEQDASLTAGATAEQRALIRRILSVALSERPEDRFASTHALVDALEGAAQADSAAVPESPAVVPDEPVRRESRRRPKEKEREKAVETPLFARVEEPTPPPIAEPVVPEAPAPVPVVAAAVPVVAAPRERTVPVPVESQVASPAAIPPAPEPRPEPRPAIAASDDSRMWPAGAASEPTIWPEHSPMLYEPPPSTPFPWSAVAAVAIAGVMLGGVLGFQYGRSTAPPPAPVDVSGPRAVDTEVPVTSSDAGRRAESPAEKPPDAPPAARASEPRASAGAAAPVRRATARGVPRQTTAGSIFVDSRPRAARVIIDGKFVGLTPLSIPELNPGGHSVRLDLAGHRSFSTRAVVKAGEQTRVTGALEER